MWFSFILTEKCDWDCCYCQFPLLSKHNELDSDKILKHVPYIKDVIRKVESVTEPSIEIQGGEVGLIERDALILFLETLGYPVYVSTNGKFLEKGYHLDKRIRPYIREIQWHVCQDVGDYKLEVDYNDDEIFINKGIVHSDIQEMVAFIKRNPHIEFNYVELECDIKEKRSSDIDALRVLYSKLEGIENVGEHVFDILKRRLNDSKDKRNKCNQYHSVVSINIPTETICLCQRVTDVNVSLTKENLIKRIQTYPNKYFQYPDSMMGCESCIRLYSGKFEFQKILKDTLKIRRVDFES